jgi:polysaccharide deacetylase family protein (PEP-CTERM system associated)
VADKAKYIPFAARIPRFGAMLLRAPLEVWTNKAGASVVRSEAGGGTGELCYLDGAFIPFAKTKAEREAKKDPRPSLAERYRDMVRSIVAQGHELASHGYAHQRATDQSPQEFYQDITRAKSLLEDVGGVAVQGYRAPSFSIGRANLWAQASLKKAGYRYSSSVYPIRHDHYGMPDAPRFAFYPDGADGLLELPVTTVSLFNRNLPAGGGGYFRLLPYGLFRKNLQSVSRQDKQPCMFYFHPWEIDSDQPRLASGLIARMRTYTGVKGMFWKLDRLLTEFQFSTLSNVYGEVGSSATVIAQ